MSLYCQFSFFFNGCVVCSIFFQGILPDLNTNIANTFIRSSEELTAGSRGDAEPVAGCQINGVAIYYSLALATGDEVDFFILFVIVNKRNAGAGRKVVYADFSSGKL